MAFVEIIALDRCRTEGGTFIEWGGLELALFRMNEPEEVIVLDNACPHASGNLSGGAISDGVVTCPWHHWEFDIKTGVCRHSDRARVNCYIAEIRNGTVWVDLPD